MMNETQRMMYQSLVSIRNNEVSLRWTRNQLFFLMNSAAVGLVFPQLKPDTYFYGGVCAVGVIVSILWLRMIYIIRMYMEYWDDMLGALEELNGNPVQIFKGEIWRSKETTRFQTSTILFTLGAIFLTVWVILFGNWYVQF